MTGRFEEPGFPSPAEALFADWLGHTNGEDLEALCREHPKEATELRKLWIYWEGLRAVLERAGLIAGPQSLADKINAQYGSGVDPNVSLDVTEEAQPPSSALLKRLAQHTFKSSRYKLQGELARGGMGAILKVFDEDLRRHLAMKVILGGAVDASSGGTPPVDGRLLARFLEEAQVTGQLDHPGIVPVHELGLDSEGRVYFTMKLVKGRDLKQIFELVFEGLEGWNEARALGVFLKVCEALAYAHKKGVVHRDLKPANVMVGNFGEVYVMDWGLARVLGRHDAHDIRLQVERTQLTSVRTERREERDEAPDSPLLTMDGDVVGTPAYMSPEQAQGAVESLGPRSDVYSLGAVLYHLLARQMPYAPPGVRITNRTVLSRVLEGPPTALHVIRKDIPSELAAICEKAMARAAEQRYADTIELSEDLRAFLEGRVVKAYETGAVAELRKWVARNRSLATAAAAAAIFLVVGLVAALVLKSRADANAELADQRRRESECNAQLAVNRQIESDENARLAEERRGEAEKSAQLAKDNEQTALAAKDEANNRTREARWQLYVSSIGGADAARRLDEPASVRRHLDAAPEEFRNWEWRYLDAVSDSSLEVLQGHTSGVASASFSPDGTRVVTSSWDKTARLWDASSGTPLARLEGHTGTVTSASFNPDGSRVVTASNDTARIWNASTGAPLAPLEGHTNGVTSASFSPDGTRIVTASYDKTARLWDASTGALLARLEGHTGAVNSGSFSTDGTRIVTASSDRTARLWGVSTGALLVRLEGHTDGVTTAFFSPDGTRIVTASNDKTARLWDASTGALLAPLEGHTAGVRSASFSPDGTHIVTASDDETARLWDASTGALLARLEGHTSWLNASFSPDGSRIVTASGDNTARLWDASSGALLGRLEGHTRSVNSASFSSDGTHIVTASSDNTARLWDASNGALLAGPEGHTDLVKSACFSPDGTRVVTASWDKTARLWDASSGAPLAGLEGHTGTVSSASFSPDGTRVVTASNDRTARLWDGSNGRLLARLEHKRSVNSASFSPDGTRIVTASNDKTARLWDASTGALLAPLEGHTAGVTSASFSSDGTRIVTASVDKTARLWDASTGALLAPLEGHTEGVTSASFSPDGTRIVTASDALSDAPLHDKTARLWDASTGALLARLEGHTAGVTSASFSPDGTRIVTASWDRTARLWDVSTGALLVRLEGHTHQVTSAFFSPDGTRIVTASWDHTARVWDASTGALLVRLEGHTKGVTSASFSPDGARIVTASDDNTARLWESVPYRLRHRVGVEIEAARQAARLVLDAALAASVDWSEAASKLREDPSIAEPVRRTAMNLLTVEANAVVMEAREWFEGLRASEVLRAPVVAAIEADRSHSDRVRNAAMELAKELEDDPKRLNGAAWEIVRDAHRDQAAYARALRAIEAAVEKQPDWGLVNTLGVAQYRNGLYEEVAATLERSMQLARRANRNHPVDLAFLAMARSRLGQAETARELLERLRERMSEQAFAEDEEAQSFLAEAEALIDPK